jgi:hypothetical protein
LNYHGDVLNYHGGVFKYPGGNGPTCRISNPTTNPHVLGRLEDNEWGMWGWRGWVGAFGGGGAMATVGIQSTTMVC